VTVEMQFLADVELTCEECRGTRFQIEILDVRYTKAKTSTTFCNMTVREAIHLFQRRQQTRQ
jgi:excinuclease ABC subunit A